MRNPRAKENLKPFQKGTDERRNLNGRPRLSNISEALRAELMVQAPGKDEATYAELIAKALVTRAIQGDVTAAREIADRTEGKAKQSMTLDMNVLDWREMAKANGLSEAEVLENAKHFIEQQSAPSSSDAQFD